MPIKAKDAAKSLKPVWVGQSLQYLIWPIIGYNDDGDFSGQLDHALEKPGGRFTAV
jgi:hypothetical protein